MHKLALFHGSSIGRWAQLLRMHNYIMSMCHRRIDHQPAELSLKSQCCRCTKHCAQSTSNLPGLDTDLRQAVADGELPPIYWNHPVVRSAINVLVHPVCIFVDGVSFGRQGWDNCIAWWAYFMFSKTRHLIAVLRKSELCSCGCRGWCSIQPIWESIKWGNDHNQRS